MSSALNLTATIIGIIVGLGAIIGALVKFRAPMHNWLQAHRRVTVTDLARVYALIDELSQRIEQQHQLGLLRSELMSKALDKAAMLEIRIDGAKKMEEQDYDRLSGNLASITRQLNLLNDWHTADNDMLQEHKNTLATIQQQLNDLRTTMNRPHAPDISDMSESLRQFVAEREAARKPLKDPPRF